MDENIFMLIRHRNGLSTVHATIFNLHVQRLIPEIAVPSHDDVLFYRVVQAVCRLARYPLTPAPDRQYNPLLSMLAWNADAWGVFTTSTDDESGIAFYPVYNNPPTERVERLRIEHRSVQPRPSGESHMHGSRRDDEQPGPSHLDNNRSEIRPGGSHVNRSSTDEEHPGEASTDDDQSGSSHMDNNSDSGYYSDDSLDLS